MSHGPARGTWEVDRLRFLGLQNSKASSRSFPQVVVFTTGREVAREDEPFCGSFKVATALATTSRGGGREVE
ncbi:hypothetical protein H5410_027873 [Solanum commersonii]|uniref:Uncharacterized protein n=1 Tax=Solanum commersonii TaxID=4109 RepID=A0A9J5Z2F6_SOLCO|nr:hypothetical protein H5410_027873 [Solanum commersonii]